MASANHIEITVSLRPELIHDQDRFADDLAAAAFNLIERRRREETPDAVVQLRALMESVGDALDRVRPADADSGHGLDHLEEALAAAAEWEATWCAERAGRAG